jgi:hypothetical protein
MIIGMERNKQDQRWTAFSNEEIAELAGLVAAADESYDLSPRAERLSAQIKAERDNRDQAPSYRGPGVYRSGDKTYEVLGTVGDPRAMGDKTKMVLRDAGDTSGVLMLEPVERFEDREPDGSRYYVWEGEL